MQNWIKSRRIWLWSSWSVLISKQNTYKAIPCTVLNGYQCFGRSTISIFRISSIDKEKAEGSSEMLVPITKLNGLKFQKTLKLHTLPWVSLDRAVGVSSTGRVKNFLLCTSSRPALGYIQPPIQWTPRAFSPGVKRPGCEADHSPSASAEVKKMWIYTSTPPCLIG
jgi:hypothetical protein